MCISGPKLTGGQVPAPTNPVADTLKLGSSDIQQRQAGQIGRAALTAAAATQRAITKQTSPVATTPTPATSPAGTLGLPTSSIPRSTPIYGGTGP